MSKFLPEEINQPAKHFHKKARIKNADGPISPQPPTTITPPLQQSTTAALLTPSILNFIYETALEFFNDKQYNKALELLDNLFQNLNSIPVAPEERFLTLFNQTYTGLLKTNQVSILPREEPLFLTNNTTTPNEISLSAPQLTTQKHCFTFSANANDCNLMSDSPLSPISTVIHLETSEYKSSSSLNYFKDILDATPTKENLNLSMQDTTLPIGSTTLFTASDYAKSKSLYDNEQFQLVITYLEEKISSAQLNAQFDQVGFKCIELLVNSCLVVYSTSTTDIPDLLKKSENYLNFLLENANQPNFLEETIEAIELLDKLKNINMNEKIQQKIYANYKLFNATTLKTKKKPLDKSKEETLKPILEPNVIELTTPTDQDSTIFPLTPIAFTDTNYEQISFELPSTPSMYFLNDE